MEKLKPNPVRYWSINIVVILTAYLGFVEGVEWARTVAMILMWLTFAFALVSVPLFPLIAQKVRVNAVRETLVDAPVIWFAILGGAYWSAGAFVAQLVYLILVHLASVYVYKDE